MPRHSYSRCWVHLVWGTLRRERVLAPGSAAKVSNFLHEYARTKSIYLKINYVNADHAHALIDLPTGTSIEETVQLLKGGSSHWINAHNLVTAKFAWGRGYGAFSVSASAVETVSRYIADQEQHHRRRTFAEELQEFVERYGLKWRGDKAVETALGNEMPRSPG